MVSNEQAPIMNLSQVPSELLALRNAIRWISNTAAPPMKITHPHKNTITPSARLANVKPPDVLLAPIKI
jgi:hypothetical protein